MDRLQESVAAFKNRALKIRGNRVRPGTDDKVILSWNAMTITGLADAYEALGYTEYLHLAKDQLGFLNDHFSSKNGVMLHTYKKGAREIPAYLEDYAFYVEACIRLYEITFEERYLEMARRKIDFVFTHFEQHPSGMFYFKSKDDPALVAKKLEINDNVIPASNSVLATALFRLGHLMSETKYVEHARKMYTHVEPSLTRYPAGYSRWMELGLSLSTPFFEVAIVGKQCEEKRKALVQNYMPNTVICGSEKSGNLDLLKDRFVEGQTLIYVCSNGACQLPTDQVDKALELLR